METMDVAGSVEPAMKTHFAQTTLSALRWHAFLPARNKSAETTGVEGYVAPVNSAKNAT